MISIILPVFNEGKNIRKQIEAIEKSQKVNHEILVVFDFDNDDTVPIVRNLQKSIENLRLIKNSFGKGVINAVKTGLDQSLGDVIVVMSADIADNPKTINRMYSKINEGFDIVCATRYSKGGKKIGGGFLKTTLSRIAGLSSPYILGIPTTDITNGFKMYKKNVLDQIEIESSGGWEFTLETIIKAHHLGFKIAEVGTTWHTRISGKSKFKLLKWLPQYLKWYAWGIVKRFKDQ